MLGLCRIMLFFFLNSKFKEAEASSKNYQLVHPEASWNFLCRACSNVIQIESVGYKMLIM